MLDIEISEYLKKHDFAVNAQDCLMKVLNTSHQIISEDYDFESGIMTITTPDNIFKFKWILGNPQKEENKNDHIFKDETQ